MKPYFKALLLATLFITTKSFALTWDEPWAKQVIKEAGSFVLAKIISNDPEKGINIQIIKTLGGDAITGSVLINNFYLLDICSSSGGHGPEFHTVAVDSCYFFIKKNEKGQYCIATPTTGFDYVYESKVVATYRHSYHQASVPVTVYEKTMTAIFNRYHGLPFDSDYVSKLVNEYLSKKPAGFGEDEINTFFLQHVALECVYHLGLNINETLVLPFLNDKNSFHNQVSAARAMSAFNTDTNKQELLKAIADTTKRNFVRVMCVWSLRDLAAAKELKPQLESLEKNASDETDGFGGNIMDSRVCTRVPSLKDAINELINNL
jgi:hypothetical protein